MFRWQDPRWISKASWEGTREVIWLHPTGSLIKVHRICFWVIYTLHHRGRRTEHSLLLIISSQFSPKQLPHCTFCAIIALIVWSCVAPTKPDVLCRFMTSWTEPVPPHIHLPRVPKVFLQTKPEALKAKVDSFLYGHQLQACSSCCRQGYIMGGQEKVFTIPFLALPFLYRLSKFPMPN